MVGSPVSAPVLTITSPINGPISVNFKPQPNFAGESSEPSGKTRTPGVRLSLQLIEWLIAPVLLLVLIVSAQAATFTVTNTGDSGGGSLRQAIADANGNPGADTIAFNIPGAGVHTISPLTVLPLITDPVTIDGYSQPGANQNSLAVGDDAVLLIEISGASVAGSFTDGLDIKAGNCTIRGLVINRFPEYGIQFVFGDPGSNIISGNFIGCNPGGTIPLPNGTGGLYFNRSPNNTIGGLTPAARNVISGNGQIGSGNSAPGIEIDGDQNTFVPGNLIQGNYIGVNAAGTAALPNQSPGILVDFVTSTTIGGSTAAARNIISGNKNAGVDMFLVTNSLVQGNYIGADATGTQKIPNGSGVSLSNSTGNKIGGVASGEGNLISGNQGNGMEIQQLSNGTTTNNLVQGNLIGTDKNGSAALGNGNCGVVFSSGNPANNTIGGLTAGSGNVISGNVTAGIFIAGNNPTSNLIQGNLVGTNVTGQTAIGNGEGITVYAGTANLIGGSVIQARNIIAGNIGNGVHFLFPQPGQMVQGNLIGTDGSGNVALGNGLAGILIENSTNQTIGGTGAGAGNIIFFNSTGIAITGGASINNAIEGNFIHANTGLNTESGLGIDLNYDGVTLNDAGDADTGPNNSQNYPVISSAVINAGAAVVTGTLNSTAATQFRVEFFSSPSCDPSGFGEGRIFLGSAQVTTNASGDANINANLPGVQLGEFITTTATSPTGNTSEFSQCAAAQNAGVGTLQFSSVSSNTGEGAGPATITVTRTGGTTGAVSVHYATSDGTAVAGSDYAAAAGTLNWADGDGANKTFTIPITNDSLNEASETIGLTLSAPTGGAVIGNPGSATLAILDNDPTPSISITDVSLAEGNSGATNFNFTVSLSAASGQTITVDYATADGTALSGGDYQPLSGTLTFSPGQTAKPVTVLVNGDTQGEPNETFLVGLANVVNATVDKDHGTGTIVNDDGVTPPALQFSSATYNTQENLTALTITVTRTGDTSGSATVDYATADGTAKQQSDYELTTGALSFAPGDTTRTFQLLINEDMYVEGDETLTVVLSNATGATLGSPATATVTIVDDAAESLSNPIDDSQSFVYTHYHDFLSREPDPGGLAFWTSQITQCGNDQNCLRAKRIDVSNAYFYEQEYQQTGAYVFRLYRVAFGNNQPLPNGDNSNTTEAHKLPNYLVFAADRARVIGGANLAQGQQNLATAFVLRPEFISKYPANLSLDQFVDAVLATISNDLGVNLNAQRSALIALGSRGAVIYRLADENVANPISNQLLIDAEYNRAFVATQYFGYLRRDSDIGGFLFWLGQVNSAPLRSVSRQHAMVCSFITSSEYQDRFGTIHQHSNAECGP